jgi:hypothetical protein
MWLKARRKPMRKAAQKWALLAGLALVPAGAHAATYSFDFSTDDSVFTVAATITAADTLDAVGGYDILSISGTISGPGGGAITLATNTSQPFPDYIVTFMYDNVIYPNTASQVDGYGILFSAGGYDYNLYAAGPGAYYLSTFNPAGVYDPGAAVVFAGDSVMRADAAGAAPEPATWALMLLGFAGLGLAAQRKARRSRALAIGSAQQA